MKRIENEGRWLEYEERGDGEPVLLIHGTLIGDALRPVFEEPSLAGYRLIRYRRRGFCGNAIPQGAGWLDISDHASDAAMLLDHLGVSQVHVVGHDLGGVIAIQLALARPRMVHSLALLEPVLLGVPGWEAALSELAPAIDLFLAGDRPGAVELFLNLGSGPEGKDILEGAIPGALARAIDDSPAFFEGEMFAIGEWQLSPDVAFDISQPVLSVLGEHPLGLFAEGRNLLHRLFPQVEDLDIFNAGHLFPLENPQMLAGGLAWFMGRHPIRPTAG